MQTQNSIFKGLVPDQDNDIQEIQYKKSTIIWQTGI